MTITTNLDVFEDLRNAQDELLRMTRMPGQWLAQPGSQPGGYASQAWGPAVDITERKDNYVVTAEVPGVEAADLEVTFADGLLTIQGKRHPADDISDDKVHRAERRYGAFRRSITLPSHVQADKIDATTQDGVLRIVLPKTDEVRAKHIQVHPGRAKPAVMAPAAKNGG
ncbi:MAG TPA: Hsp20/alpha crystallin family protein [Streptosporangiaceae bacterium]|nr:Hsp20/alpha crystallin family protein [Streptosporangiaceae bacterium]